MKLLPTAFLQRALLVGPHSEVLSLGSLIRRTVCCTVVSFNNWFIFICVLSTNFTSVFVCLFVCLFVCCFQALISVCIKYIFLELSRSPSKAN